MATLEMTAANHDETITKDGIVLIDFWAEWCGPCKRFAPIFEKVSDKHEDAVFAKVDTEAQQELAAQYGITAIPTLVVYRDGVPIFAQPGAVPESALETILEKVKELDMDEARAHHEAQVKARDEARS